MKKIHRILIIWVVFSSIGVGCQAVEDPVNLEVKTQESTSTELPIETPTVTTAVETPTKIIETMVPFPDDMAGEITTDQFQINFDTGEMKKLSIDLEEIDCEVIVGYEPDEDLIVCANEAYQNTFSYSIKTEEVVDIILPDGFAVLQLLDHGRKLFVGKIESHETFSSPYMIMDRETLSIEKELFLGELINVPAISESGNNIAYRKKLEDENILVINTNGSEIFLDDETLGGGAIAYSWSPDEEKLVIGITTIIEPEAPLTDILVYDLTENKLNSYQEILEGKTFWSFSRLNDQMYFQLGIPKEVWSPNSNLISINTYTDEICVIDISQDEFHCWYVPTKNSLYTYRHYFWSPDSSFLGVFTGSSPIFIYDLKSQDQFIELPLEDELNFIYWKN